MQQASAVNAMLNVFAALGITGGSQLAYVVTTCYVNHLLQNIAAIRVTLCTQNIVISLRIIPVYLPVYLDAQGC